MIAIDAFGSFVAGRVSRLRTLGVKTCMVKLRSITPINSLPKAGDEPRRLGSLSGGCGDTGRTPSCRPRTGQHRRSAPRCLGCPGLRRGRTISVSTPAASDARSVSIRAALDTGSGRSWAVRFGWGPSAHLIRSARGRRRRAFSTWSDEESGMSVRAVCRLSPSTDQRSSGVQKA